MGIGAIAGIAGAVGSLASAGVGIAGALGGSSPQQQAGQYNAQLKALANMYLSPYMNQNYWNLNLPDMATQSINFGLGAAPAVNYANMQQLQGLLNQALPGYQNLVNQAATIPGQQMAYGQQLLRTAQPLLAGQVPQDVADQIQRSAAFATLRSGAFAGGAPTGALTARDLGLTSLNLMGQGAQLGGQGISALTAAQAGTQNLIGMTKQYLMPQPVNPLSLLPLSDLISGNTWSKVQQYNATQNYVNMRAQGAAAQYGVPYQSNLGALGGAITSGLGSLTATNPQTGQGGIGSLLSLLGGLGGGGGGGGGLSGGQLTALSGIGSLADF